MAGGGRGTQKSTAPAALKEPAVLLESAALLEYRSANRIQEDRAWRDFYPDGSFVPPPGAGRALFSISDTALTTAPAMPPSEK